MKELVKVQQQLTKDVVAAALYTPELRQQLQNLALSLQKPVTTVEEQAILKLSISQASKSIKLAEDIRKEKTQQVDAIKKAFMDAEKELLAEVQQWLTTAKNNELAFIRKQAAEAEAKRKEIEKEQAAKANRTRSVEGAARVENETQLRMQTVTAPVGARMLWVHALTDITKVPAEYLQLNDAAIKEAIKAGVREIPGILIKQEVGRSGRN